MKKSCSVIVLLALILLISPKSFGQGITTIAGNGASGFSGDAGGALLARLNNAMAVAIDSFGNVYIGDQSNARIRKVSITGVITTVAGTGTAGFSGDGGPATIAQLNGPSDVAFDVSANMYIVDGLNNRVRKVTPSGVISTFAGSGVGGFGGDGGPATSAQLHQPSGISIDHAGNVYIADQLNYRIRKVSTSGVISTVAGTGTSGFSGDGGPATSAQLSAVWDVVVDASGGFYITDYNNNRIRKVTASGTITTMAGTGTSGYSGDGAAATLAQLSHPGSVAIDPGGNIFFTDNDNNRIRVVDISGTINTIAGVGTHGFSGDGFSAVLAELATPTGVAVDGVGYVYIADHDNNRIRKVVSCTIPLVGPILGDTAICLGNTTSLVDTTLGGQWVSSDPSVATVTYSSGLAGAVSVGTATISFMVANNCATSVATHTFHVLGVPNAGVITGATNVCPGNLVTLVDTSTGGVWSSTHTSLATVSTTGVVTAVSSGLDSIKYTISNMCGADTAFFPLLVKDVSECPSGISNAQVISENELVIYPNPNDGSFTLQLPSTLQVELPVTVTNVVGQEVATFLLASNRSQAVQLQLHGGVYFVCVHTSTGKITKRVVVE